MNAMLEPAREAPVAVARAPGIAPGAWRRWLRAGWSDLRAHRGPALRYGAGVVAALWGAALLLFLTGLEWMLLPGLAGAMLVGPLIAAGLYRLVDEGSGEPRRSPDRLQLLLLGATLLALMLTWIRAATLLYALFFGLTPFPGFQAQMALLVGTGEGRALMAVGALVGGLFAALAFALSAFSIPLAAARDVDAFSAMGRSFSAVTHNLPEALKWAAALLALSLLCVATGLAAAIWIVPWLGFASWRAYREVFEQAAPESGRDRRWEEARHGRR